MVRFMFTVIVFNLVIGYNLVFSDQTSIAKVKLLVLQECKKNISLCNLADLERIRTNDWIVERWLIESSQDIETAAKSLTEMIQFYQREKLHELSIEYFPSEFYATGSYLFSQNPSFYKNGRQFVGIDMRCIVFTYSYLPLKSMSKEMNSLFAKFTTYFLFRRFWINLKPINDILMIKGNDMGPSNVDMDFYKNLAKFMQYYSVPEKSDYLVVDVNSVAKLLFETILRTVSQRVGDNTRWIEMKDVQGFGVNLQSVPKHLGGELQYFNRIPKGVKSGKCLPHLNYIPTEEWNAFRDGNSHCIKEGMDESNVSDMEQYLGSC